jgi:hypothetical protein
MGMGSSAAYSVNLNFALLGIILVVISRMEVWATRGTEALFDSLCEVSFSKILGFVHYTE